MKLVRTFLLLFHLFILVLLVGMLFNSWVPPKTFPLFNLLSLAFPILMITHLLLCILWILLWKKRAFFFILMTVFFINATKRWINFSPAKKEVPNLKIMTFNTHTGLSQFKKISDYIEETKPDIAILQEVAPDAHSNFYKNQISEFYILYIGTNLEIVKKGKVQNSGSNGNCFYADVKVNDKIIRIVNVYLNPFAMDKSTVAPNENLEDNKVKAKYVLKKLIPNFKKHQEEVIAIKEFLDSSPYPVILAGDFNSVPNSYEYYHLAKGLQDAFVEVGNGSSTSFHDYKFPIRIDYVFCSKEIIPISYKVDRSVKISDHFPVFAEFSVK